MQKRGIIRPYKNNRLVKKGTKDVGLSKIGKRETSKVLTKKEKDKNKVFYGQKSIYIFEL